MTVELAADAVVLDIEGTTTPIAFVHDVLFAHARAHLEAFLARRAGDPDVTRAIATLADEHAAEPDPARPASFVVASYARWLMDRDRKSTGLKALQGLIWGEGYASGALRSEIYPDVPAALAGWRAGGITIAIYSSGSVQAQALLFRHTIHGDLTASIDRYFDTTTGPKRAATSYQRIAAELGTAPGRVVFISDVGEELLAARDAGVRGVLAIRPGNAPVAADVTRQFPAIHSFAGLRLSRSVPVAKGDVT